MTGTASAGVSELTYREALRRALADQLAGDPDVLLLGEDIGAYGGIMFMDFSLVAADQLLNQAAKMRYLSGDQWKVPLTVRTQQGVGAGTAAQHSQCLEALFMHVPGFAIALPAFPADAKGLLSEAIQLDSPALVIEHKALYGSRSVHTCLDAAQSLAADGISAEVIDLRTLVPLDMAAVVESFSRTRRLVLVHEAHRNCGPAAEIAARVTEQA